MPKNTKRTDYSYWFPSDGKPIWLMFDTANGDKSTYRYVWWFESRKKALEYKQEQNKRFKQGKLNYYVVGPFKFVPSK